MVSGCVELSGCRWGLRCTTPAQAQGPTCLSPVLQPHTGYQVHSCVASPLAGCLLAPLPALLLVLLWSCKVSMGKHAEGSHTYGLGSGHLNGISRPTVAPGVIATTLKAGWHYQLHSPPQDAELKARPVLGQQVFCP